MLKASHKSMWDPFQSYQQTLTRGSESSRSLNKKVLDIDEKQHWEVILYPLLCRTQFLETTIGIHCDSVTAWYRKLSTRVFLQVFLIVAVLPLDHYPYLVYLYIWKGNKERGFYDFYYVYIVYNVVYMYINFGLHARNRLSEDLIS